MLFLRSRIEVYTVLVFGLFYAAFSCAAMPLSQSELSTRADNAELQEVSFSIEFPEPEANERHLYDVQNKDLTVKQIQTYMDRVAIGFGFRPMVHIDDATGTPYRQDRDHAVLFSFRLQTPQSVSEKIQREWGFSNDVYIQVSHPFVPRSLAILNPQNQQIFRMRDTDLRTTSKRYTLPPAEVVHLSTE
ncbi:uncharacterized protein C8R40DRAFT_1136986 [Lentinula edodes]|uniref:uncharacterized protein n=1 Tax=Lentinula edodes TaxID=5353 RepID=UPI001E8D9A66|nr:uncharacterized protein C8R40DRAFT_1136986 [Lentinula edodes]KAH7867883.1 hypothetical protein C8R40DRAFT_1136986 [Lentinula edodes]